MSCSGPAHPTRAGRLLDVERFERVAAPGATALLRLTGRLQPYARVDDAALALVIDHAGETHRFAPLPAPLPAHGRRAPGEQLTVAFAVPTRLLADGRAAYALRLAADAVAELAAPAERILPGAAAAVAEARVRELEGQIRRLQGRAAETDALVGELARLRALTELQGRALRTDDVRAELELALVRIGELETHGEQERRRSAEATRLAQGERDELHSRLELALAQHGEVVAELEAVRAERAMLAHELEAARALVAEARSEVERLTASLRTLEARVAELEADRDAALERLGALEVERAQAERQATEHEAALADAEAWVARLQATRDELAARLQGLEVEVDRAHADGDDRAQAAEARAQESTTLLVEAEARLADLEAAREVAGREALSLAAERDEAERRATRLASERDAAAGALADLEKRLEEAERGRLDALGAVAAEREQAASAQEHVRELSARIEELEGRPALAPDAAAERSGRDVAARAEDALRGAEAERIDLERNLAAAWEYAVGIEGRLGDECAARGELEERVEGLLAHQEALALRVEELIAARRAAESARDVLATRLGSAGEHALAGD
jgi:chromosome segregation ATPase